MKHDAVCTGRKVCARCHETKPSLAFAAHRDSVDGLHSYCRDCMSVYSAERRHAKGRRPSCYLLPALEG